MNMEEVTKALQQAFHQSLNEGEQRKIIFWFDKDQEFAEYIHEIGIEGVRVRTLNEGNSFYTKVLLEEEDPSTNYLIYSNLDISMEGNWLLDTILYSKTFYADKISLIMNELNIDPSLRSVVKKYEKFFGSKDRVKRFKGFEVSAFTEESIELMIMSALCNLKTPDFEDVLKVVLMDSLDDSENKHLDSIAKYVGIDVFWNAVAERYGYEPTRKSLKTLFIHLTVTALSYVVNEDRLSQIENYIATRNKSNALVFIDHWMHHKTDYLMYDQYAEIVEKEIKLSDIVNSLPVEEFKVADTFPYFDKAIIIFIANSLEDRLEDYEAYTKLINLRRAKHYYERYQSIYEALYYTVKMFEFHKKYSMGIPKTQAVDMYRAYVNDYHKMDMYYRKFYFAYDNDSNSEILKKLKVMAESLYTNWYMGELSSHWSAAVHDELKSSWVLPGIQSQKDFYRSFVAPKISNGDRVFVIISDALRYEIASELTDKLNSETTGACDIQPLLGVVPSVTKMGMASLLPHMNLEVDLNGNVLVNGKSSSGMDNRVSILQAEVADSTSIHFQELKNMNKAVRRETFKGKKLVYIYHDSIDATGDKASTEVYTFTATGEGHR